MIELRITIWATFFVACYFGIISLQNKGNNRNRDGLCCLLLSFIIGSLIVIFQNILTEPWGGNIGDYGLIITGGMIFIFLALVFLHNTGIRERWESISEITILRLLYLLMGYFFSAVVCDYFLIFLQNVFPH